MSYIKYENFFSKDEISLIVKESQDILKDKSSRFRTNYTSWDFNIVQDSNFILIFDITSENKTLSTIQNSFKKQFSIIPEVVMFYYWFPGSYIPWHEDSHVTKAYTLYLNNEWDKHWGGSYTCINNNKIEAFYPQYNLLVEQFNGMEHCTSPTTKFAPVRSTVQIFID